MKFTVTDISELVVALALLSGVMLTLVTIAIRFGVRPLLADWAKLRTQGGGPSLERRVLELEEEMRQLKNGTNLQLSAESVRSGKQHT